MRGIALDNNNPWLSGKFDEIRHTAREDVGKSAKDLEELIGYLVEFSEFGIEEIPDYLLRVQ